jgi:hypothetical protein
MNGHMTECVVLCANQHPVVQTSLASGNVAGKSILMFFFRGDQQVAAHSATHVAGARYQAGT